MTQFENENRAQDILKARRDRRQIACTGPGELPMDAAYRISRRIRDLRTDDGERVVGRKLGFTNRTIWDEYNVHAPIWGYMYDTTFHDVSSAETPFSLAPFCEPRIEPEIAFAFTRAPGPEQATTNCSALLPGTRTASRSSIRSTRTGNSKRPTQWPPSACTVPICADRAGKWRMKMLLCCGRLCKAFRSNSRAMARRSTPATVQMFLAARCRRSAMPSR